jgi:UDP-N-acetylmuramoyl-L-alanyl-D-glutamate--2,6-diaminopimelate ligase
MQIADLIKNCNTTGLALDITADSRKVKPGSLLFILPRAEKQFEKIYKEATDKKASLIVHGLESQKSRGHYVKNIQVTYTKTLQTFYKESFENLKVYGLTGTNGKTSVATMLKNLLDTYHIPTGLYGTVGNFFRNNVLDTGLTSSMADDFYRFNHSNYEQGMKAVVCEVSSHALDQKRLSVNFLSGAGFTSFSQDHLDYHKTMDAYLEAKGKIFSEALIKDGFFVYPKSLKEFQVLKPLEDQKIICLGGDDYTYKIHKADFSGVEMEFSKNGKSLKGLLPLYGDYNAENFAMALVFLCEHFRTQGINDFFPDQKVFDQFKQISGRMERFTVCRHEGGEESFAVVDFSHTPDSLEKALKTLRELLPNHELSVVFGCGGDRDSAKRPLMGKIASRLADKVVVTNDNPRTEEPEMIADQIVEGLEKAKHFKVELDRASAIRNALNEASAKPAVVLIAGKGHEQTQEINGEKHFFSDQKEIKKWIVENRLGEKL